MSFIGGLPIDVISNIILFLKIEAIKHKIELTSKSLHDVATRKGMWCRLYFRDFLTSKSKVTKRPPPSRKRRRLGHPVETPRPVGATNRHVFPEVPDRPWDILYRARYEKKLHDANFVTQSSEAQTAILDLELAESMVDKGPHETETAGDEDLESLLIDAMPEPVQKSATHDCGLCCKAAVPSKDQFGIFVCPYTGRMFEASTMKQVTDNWDNEYSPFVSEDVGVDDGSGMRDDGYEDWTRPGVWGRCFSDGYNCVNESECDRMLCRYKRNGTRWCRGPSAGGEKPSQGRKLRKIDSQNCEAVLDLIDHCCSC
eukprot:Gregarina_sp_Pseudo_9__1925@NODE_2323_length_1040_cov_11_966034_g2139_i0_p1_GENE_NODE_2323_length_1040_cov_11_966034_g2139_i0NODE_2323_length_1040_cov_11_966034_g2139_i0_p1_ORF_typecomplete_len313_score51_32Elongin_A/PF06881_11/0_015_NODE_2323_length_1040_cov_11_966034_g2139_i0761014